MSAPICGNENITEKIRYERRIVDLLKREIHRVDRKLESKYIRSFLEEFSDYRELSSYRDLIEAARKVRIVYVGDYHALAAYQYFQARLLSELADSAVVLALEAFYSRNQRALDEWMAGRADDARFLRRVRFDLEWGYSWESYRTVLAEARRLQVPVFGIDCSPRTDLRLIRKRDAAIAAKIADLHRRFPDRILMVCIGESHLARQHLPAKVSSILGADAPATLTVLQNLDEIHWKLACRGHEGEGVVRLAGDAFCVFNATPFEKYEGYRRRLEIWKSRDREEQTDLASTVYRLVDAVAGFARIDKYRYCLSREGACTEFLVDVYPEVYGPGEMEEFVALLESEGIDRLEIREIVNHSMRQGSCYVPRVNAIWIGELDLTQCAEEAAHFLNFALQGRIYGRCLSRPRTRADRFYLTVLEESLGYFGSKLIDPRRNHPVESPILNWEGIDSRVRKLLGISARQQRKMKRFLLVHKELEHHYGRMKDLPEELRLGWRSRGRIYAILTHELGYLLGEQLYRGYLSGVFSAREISRLFRTRFEQKGNAIEAYFDLAERAEELPLRPGSSEKPARTAGPLPRRRPPGGGEATPAGSRP